MMSKSPLRIRIVWAYALLALTVCVFFAGAMSLFIGEIEHQVIARRLAQEAEWLIVHPGSSVELPTGTKLLQAAAFPDELRALDAGYHEVVLDGQHLNVMILNRAGQQYAAMDWHSDFEDLESDIDWALLGGVVAGLLLAIVLGQVTANRVLRPLTALAEAVERESAAEQLPLQALQDEIGILARAFATRAAALEQFLLRERLFTGDVSHELRTPLTIILGAAELLQVQMADQPALLSTVERLLRATLDARERVNALLLLSRAPDQLDAPRLALSVVLAQECDRAQLWLRDKSVLLERDWGEEVWVFARPELVRMMVSNLLRNACQHTEQGMVRVVLRPGRLVIEDTGPGLPAEVEQQLFQRFVRGKEALPGGAGLGLAIVSRVATHLGWQVQYEAVASGGSRFVLEFSVS